MGARGVELPWGHVFTGVLVGCAREGMKTVVLAVVGFVVPGRVGARGVELAWGHVLRRVLLVCSR